MGEKSVKCSACGSTLTAGSEEQLVKDLQHHAKEKHDMEMPAAQAKMAVKRGHT